MCGPWPTPWLGLALVASLLSVWFRISTALSEIVIGTIAQLIIGAVIGTAGADLLVIGARGHSGLYKRMIGSRADRLMHLAQCPVLVVK